jgi:hypothetical protein
MKRLAGAMKPRSCCLTKLTMYPYDRLGSQFDAGGTIHAGDTPSTFGASNSPFTNSFRANDITIDRVQG